MPFFTCDSIGCGEPGIRGEDVCFLCGRHLCATHTLKSHPCLHENSDQDSYARATEKEIKILLSKIDIDALCARAVSLRNGISCDIPSLHYDSATSMMGGMNYHIPITFQDGVTWICRIPRENVSSPPVELQNRIILSEAATLRFLADTTIPVPKVHDYGVMSPTNPVGVGYILMDKVDGKPLSDWYNVPVDRKRHVLEQLAKIFVELKNNPFSAIGCLQDPGDLSIGPIMATQFADVDENNDLQVLGPFKTSIEYRLATVQQQMHLVARGEVHHANAVNSYLVHRYLLDCVPAFTRQEQSSPSKFYLKNMDDKGDHILVDDNFNITGIIDWEWAQTTSQEEAFSAPFLLLNVGDYYDWRNELSEDEALFASILDEQGHEELASFVRNGRIQHRWMSCLGGDGGYDDDLRTMLCGLLVTLHRSQQGWDVWHNEALAKYEDDEGLKALLRKREVS